MAKIDNEPKAQQSVVTQRNAAMASVKAPKQGKSAKKESK